MCDVRGLGYPNDVKEMVHVHAVHLYLNSDIIIHSYFSDQF